MVINNYEDYEGYVAFDYYDDECREKLILQYKNEGATCKKGFQFWIKKESEELAERRRNKAENLKNVVGVASTGKPSLLAIQQQRCSSSNEAKSWSSDSPLLIKPLASRSPSTSYNPPVPLLTWENYSTKKRTAGYNAVHHERPNRCQKMIIIKTEQVHNQPKEIKRKEEAKNKERKKKKKNTPIPPQDMPNDLLQAITELGGTNPVWLAEKELTKSDVDRHLSRYFIPSYGIETLQKFMTAEENNEMKQGAGLRVMVVNSSGKQFQLDFKIWISLEQYVLTGVNWNAMVESLGMKAELDSVQLWGFRLPAEQGSSLCFATNIVRGPPNTLIPKKIDILEEEPA